MSVRRVLVSFVLVAAAVAIGGCNSDQATVRVSMTDGPILGYDQVMLQVTQVSLHRLGVAEDSLDVEVLSNGTTTVDLLTLQNGVFTQLAIGNVPEGQFDEIRLTVGTGSTITIGGQTFPLRVESGVVKIVCPGGFTATGGTTTDVVLDFDLSKTQFILQGNGEYHMTPVIHCLPQRLAGAIAGTILPAGITADVTATMQENPGEVRTAFVSDTGLTAGKFQLSVLAAGTYDVTIHPTTLGFQDAVISNVVVTAGHTTDLGTITLLTVAGTSAQAGAGVTERATTP